jgi:hypothetical protein
MQYRPADLGLGSCWVQIRERSMADGEPAATSGFLLGYPKLAACLYSARLSAMERKLQDESQLKWESVHVFGSEE